jgi:hypothetical protein
LVFVILWTEYHSNNRTSKLKPQRLRTGWAPKNIQGDKNVFVHLMITVRCKTQCIRTVLTQLMIWRWPSQNTFGMWTVLCWTPSSRIQFSVSINLLAPEFLKFFLAHPVCKMWIIQEPKKVAVWNKRHFEEKEMESVQHV